MNFEALLERLLNVAADLLLRLLAALLLLILGRWLIKLLLRSLQVGKAVQRADPAVRRFLINSLRVALNVLLAVSVIAVLGIPMTSALALLTSAGVAIGLALQGALGNLAGGVMILIFRPFRLEDYVEAGSFGGTVTDIGFFYTVLRTPDNRTVTIPNGTVMSEEIVNYSTNPTRRLDLTFSVAYGHDPRRVRAIILEEACRHEGVLREPPPFCPLTEQGEHALQLTLRVWVNTPDYWTLKFDLTEAIHCRLEREGISVPFPQLDVHLSSKPSPTQRADEPPSDE